MSETVDPPTLNPPAAQPAAEADAAEHAAPPARPKTREERQAEERSRIVGALSTGEGDRVLERVALVLSRYPETRDNDQALQLRYWRTYQPEQYAALDAGNAATLYDLAPLTTLTRARRRIQYTHGLFAASEKVRRRRGALSDEARERYMNPPPADPTITVYADESGKTDAHLVVGSIWFIDSTATVAVYNRIAAWRRESGFTGEFHFADLTQRTLPLYQDAFRRALDGIAGVSFKTVSVPRAGVANVESAIDQLYIELCRRGVSHEHASGRAPLPRRLTVFKDLEEEGRDKLLMSRLRTALVTASALEFDGRLSVETLEPLGSEMDPLMQLADLYTASVNRTLARTRSTDKPKDVFTDFFLDFVRPSVDATERVGDMEVHIRL